MTLECQMLIWKALVYANTFFLHFLSLNNLYRKERFFFSPQKDCSGDR